MTAGRRARTLIAVLAVVPLTVVALTACTANEPSSSSTGSTTTDPADPAVNSSTTSSVPVVTHPGGTEAPGALISATPVDAPANARAWRIVYHSRSASDRDIAVTGLLMAPATPTRDRPVVSYGHPTTGAADICTPSPGGTGVLPYPASMLARGWAVVMSDYEGLGTADAHPYLVGRSAGQTVLDAVRAAAAVPDAGVTAASPVTLLGFSQGGHAAAFAAQLAPTYAPELDVRGAAIAAPVSDVEHFAARAEKRRDQIGVLATITYGYAAAYPELRLDEVFTTAGMALVPELEKQCIGEVNEVFDRPVPETVRQPATELPAFRARFAENQAGNTPVQVPVLVVQGALDDIVDPADTAALVRRWCANGTAVESVVLPDRNHGALVETPFLDWLAARFAGQAPGPACTSA